LDKKEKRGVVEERRGKEKKRKEEKGAIKGNATEEVERKETRRQKRGFPSFPRGLFFSFPLNILTWIQNDPSHCVFLSEFLFPPFMYRNPRSIINMYLAIHCPFNDGSLDSKDYCPVSQYPLFTTHW
jgi:hypothetical protein